MAKATASPIIPRVEFVFPMPEKKVKNESTKVLKLVMANKMLLKTRTKSIGNSLLLTMVII